MADERLNILVNARNNASGALKQVKSELGGLDAAARTASGGLMGLTGALGVGAVVALGAKIGGAAIELGKMGAQSEQLRMSLQSLASQSGTTAEEMISTLQEASRGMIAEQDLMLAANKTLLLGVADNAEDMATLLQVATVRGKAMGLSVTQAFNDIVTGLGRGSALILDNLGIMVDAEATNKAYAESIGKTVAQLSELEKKQALVNKVLAEGRAMMSGAVGDLTDADKIAQAAAAWANLKTSIGEALSPGIAAAAVIAADAMDRMAENNARTSASTSGAAFGVDDAAMVGVYADKLKELQAIQAEGGALTAAQTQQLRVFTGVMNAHWDTLGKTSDTTRNLKDDVHLLADAEVAVTGPIDEATRAIARQMNQVDVAGDVIDGYIAHLQGMAAGMAGIIGTGATLSKLQAEEESVRRLTEAYDTMGWSQAQIALVMTQDTIGVEEQWQGIIDAPAEAAAAAEKAARDATSAYKKMADEVAQQFDELRGKVSGVLQGALDPGVGVNPDDLLPRQNGVNENARRVADIAVNGFTNQDWLEQFKNEVPDIAQLLQEAADPKTAAAQLLRDFQDGLIPQLIDKETAKDKVRRMITGEATMAQLATEIAQELSQEMGISMAAATTATQSALGTGGAAQLGDTGGTASAAFGEGFNGEPVGGAFVDGLTTAIIEKYGSLETSGQQAGVTWRTGFLATTTVDIPVALILALTSLITPEVQKALDAQKGQEKAY